MFRVANIDNLQKKMQKENEENISKKLYIMKYNQDIYVFENTKKMDMTSGT